jgi:serine/threonine protein kinase
MLFPAIDTTNYKDEVGIKLTIINTMGKIIENYELKEQLGEGVYAKVYKAVHLVSKQ